MTPTLRCILAAASFLTLVFIVKKIRNSKVRLEDSLFWLAFALLLLLSSLFPQILEGLATVTGVYTTSNFVFLLFIFILIIKCFSLTIKVSQLDTKTKEIAQKLAIEQFERKNQTGSSDSAQPKIF